MGRKTYVKKFENKGQMINYYNKVKENISKFEFITNGFSYRHHSYIVEYMYK